MSDKFVNSTGLATIRDWVKSIASKVSFSRNISSGTKIGSITIDGVSTDIYAPSGGGGSVQSDWDETDPASDAYILNKPTIPAKTSDLVNDSDFLSGASSWGHYTNVTLTHNSTSGNMYIWRFGPVVICQLTGIWNVKTANTRTQMSGTIPSGFRPPGTRYFGVQPVTNNTCNSMSRFEVTSGGAVYFTASATGQREFRQLTCWVTSDNEPS